jgi:hypothetical protein
MYLPEPKNTGKPTVTGIAPLPAVILMYFRAIKRWHSYAMDLDIAQRMTVAWENFEYFATQYMFEGGDEAYMHAYYVTAEDMYIQYMDQYFRSINQAIAA